MRVFGFDEISESVVEWEVPDQTPGTDHRLQALLVDCHVAFKLNPDDPPTLKDRTVTRDGDGTVLVTGMFDDRGHVGGFTFGPDENKARLRAKAAKKANFSCHDDYDDLDSDD